MQSNNPRILIVEQSPEVTGRNLTSETNKHLARVARANWSEAQANPKEQLTEASLNFREQLYKDLVRGRNFTNRILVNGEVFVESPEYDPTDPPGSLAKFIKRALFKNDEELFQKNYVDVIAYWEQFCFTLFFTVVNGGGERINRDGLFAPSPIAINNIKLDEHNKVYVETVQLNWELNKSIGRDDNQPAKEWAMPGTVTSFYRFKDGINLHSFLPSNDVLKARILFDKTIFVRKSKLAELTQAQDNNLTEERAKEILDLRNQISDIEAQLNDALNQEIASLKLIVEEKKPTSLINEALEHLPIAVVPSEDLDLYYQLISLLRLRVEYPDDASYIHLFRVLTTELAKKEWSNNIIGILNNIRDQDVKLLQKKALIELESTIESIQAPELSSLCKQILAQMQTSDVTANNIDDFLRFTVFIKNSIIQNKLFDAKILNEDNNFNNNVFVRNAEDLFFKFRKFFITRDFNEKYTQVTSLYPDTASKNPLTEQAGRVIQQINTMVAQKDLSGEAYLNMLSMLVVVLNDIIIMTNNPARINNLSSELYKEHKDLSVEVSSLANLLAEAYLAEQLKKSEETKAPKESKLSKTSSFRSKKIDDLHQSIKRKKISPDQERRLTLNLANALRLVGEQIGTEAEDVSQSPKSAASGLTLTPKQAKDIKETLDVMSKLQIDEDAGHFGEVALSQEMIDLYLVSIRQQLSTPPIFPKSEEILRAASTYMELVNLAKGDQFESAKKAYEILYNFHAAASTNSSVVAEAQLAKMKDLILDEQIKQAKKIKIQDPSLRLALSAFFLNLSKAKSFPPETLLKILSLVKSFITSPNDEEYKNFVTDIKNVFNNLPAASVNADEAVELLFALEDVRYAKAKEFFDGARSLLPQNNLVRRAAYKLISPANAAIEKNMMDLDHLSDVLVIAVRLIKSNEIKGLEDYDLAIEKLLEDSTGKIPDNLFIALENLRFAKVLETYESSLVDTEGHALLAKPAKQVIDAAVRQSAISQYEISTVLLSAAKLNNTTAQADNFVSASNTLSEFNHAIITFAQKTIPSPTAYKTEQEFKDAEAEFVDLMDALTKLSYTKAYSLLKDVALVLKGVEPYVFGTIIELMKEAKSMVDNDQLSGKELFDLSYLLNEVAYAVKNPVVYFKSEERVSFVNQLTTGNLQHLTKFKEKLIDNYAQKEANYKSAEALLKAHLTLTFNNVVSTAVKEPIQDVLTEVQRLKKIPSKEDRVPTFTRTLKQMSLLLTKPMDVTVQENTFKIADELEKKTWSQSLRAKVVIGLGFALLPILPISIPLIAWGVVSYKKEEEKRSQGLSFLTQKTATTAETTVKQEGLQTGEYQSKYSKYIK